MMKVKVYAVYDSKAEAYLMPMFFQSRGVSLRAFEVAANTTTHDFHKYAADFTLFEIGDWDDSSGLIVMYDAKISLGTALEFIKPSAVPGQNGLDLGGHSVGHRVGARTIPAVEDDSRKS